MRHTQCDNENIDFGIELSMAIKLQKLNHISIDLDDNNEPIFQNSDFKDLLQSPHLNTFF